MFGEAAKIRQRVEESVSEKQRQTIWARYGDSESARSRKFEGIEGISENYRRKLRRSDELMQDCIWHIVCSDLERENCPMHKINKKHGIAIGTVYNTIVELRKILRHHQDAAGSVLRRVFKRDNFL